MEKELTQERILEIIQENYNKFKGSNEAELMSSHDIFDLIFKQKAEITEYRQRIEENVKSIESMLHHNSVQKAEIERLRKAGDELYKLIKKHRIDGADIVGDNVIVALTYWNTLTKKEVNNG